MEQRHLIWTTYRNINIRFETLKHFLIDKGFAREKIDEDRLVLCELVYFESQSNRILNIDESEFSTDGTSNFQAAAPSPSFGPQMVTYLKERQLLIRVDTSQHSLEVVHLQYVQ